MYSCNHSTKSVSVDELTGSLSFATCYLIFISDIAFCLQDNTSRNKVASSIDEVAL